MSLDALRAAVGNDAPLLDRMIEQARRGTDNTDPSHDWLHVERVAANAGRLARLEGADLLISASAALLHELVNLPKSDPLSHRASVQAAAAAREVLAPLGLDAARIERVAVCIEEHPFSRQTAPSSLESAVLQDADRLDAIGSIGIARCLATAGTIRRTFYSPHDPFCRARPPDDSRWALDHFYRKLLRIPERLNTVTAKRLAAPRIQVMQAWLDALEAEIG